MPSLEFDLSAVAALADDVAAMADEAAIRARAVVRTSATAVKAGLRADMASSQHFGQVANAITYDLTGNASYAEAKIGPEKGSPGSLANIAYFGSSRGGGASVRDPQGPLDEEAGNFEESISAIIGDLL